MLLYSPSLLSSTSPDPGRKGRAITHPSSEPPMRCVRRFSILPLNYPAHPDARDWMVLSCMRAIISVKARKLTRRFKFVKPRMFYYNGGIQGIDGGPPVIEVPEE
jgi:hypothetical protein